MRTLFAALLLSTSLIATPVLAQSKKELAAVDAQLAQRLSTLESRMLTGDPAAERLMQRMDALETSMRTLRGEVEQLRFERDSLLQQVQAMAGDTALDQDLINRMKIHLDAVDLVASEQRAAPQPRDPYAPRTYSGGAGAVISSAPVMGTETFSSQPVTPDSGTLTQVPSAPIFKEKTISVQQEFNDVSQLSTVGQTKLAEGDFLGAQTAFRQYLEQVKSISGSARVIMCAADMPMRRMPISHRCVKTRKARKHPMPWYAWRRHSASLVINPKPARRSQHSPRNFQTLRQA